MSLAQTKYKPGGAVLRDFMTCNDFVRGIRGPIGSGTSTACVVELFRRAAAQEPGPDGIRRSRSVVIRNTFPMLKTTTIKTWLDWLPERDFGRFNHSPPFHQTIKINDIEWEVFFLAMDHEDHVEKLLSLELTTAWINEARQVPKAIVDALTGRLRRYPAMKDGGPTWSGLIMDTNAPSEHHWWPVMSGEVPPPDWLTREERLMLIKPENWEFFIQPPALNETLDNEGNVIGYNLYEGAENIANLDPKYYPELISGKLKSWIDVYVMNRLGSAADGKPVYPEYTQRLHLAKEPLSYHPGSDIYVGIDFGLTPAAVFAQRLNSRWFILDELVRTDMGAKQFAIPLKEKLDSYENCKAIIFGDPAGDHRAQTDTRTPFELLKAGGVNAKPAPTNDPTLRIDSVAEMLSSLIEGSPRMVISPTCNVLKGGFSGEYCYAKKPGTMDQYDDRPLKNRFSHVHDALQYLIIGAGEGKQLMRGHKEAQPTQILRKQSGIWKRRSRQQEPRSSIRF